MTKENMKDFSSLPPIVAVDFDGTLVVDKYPGIGRENENTCNCIRLLQKIGVKSILWTSRTGKELKDAIEWCKEHDLQFDTVNENLPEVIELAGGIDTRKVFADVYIDDRNHGLDEVQWLGKNELRGLWKWLGKTV